MNAVPRVSVIIPTCNRADTICEAVDSVLGQSWPDVEVVVVDDGSTDSTQEVLRKYGERITYLRQQNLGASTARNLGVLHSNGEFVMFLDSDDIIYPQAIEKLAQALANAPEAGAAYCGWRTVKQPTGQVDVSPLDNPGGDVFIDMCKRSLCVVQSAMVRRQALAQSGLFDAALRQYEDIDFWVRVASVCRFVFVPEHLVEYRRGHISSSAEPKGLEQSARIVLGKLSLLRSSGRIGRRDWPAVRRRIRENYANNCYIIARNCLRAGENRRAVRYMVRAIVFKPGNMIRRTPMLALLRSAGYSIVSPHHVSPYQS